MTDEGHYSCKSMTAIMGKKSKQNEEEIENRERKDEKNQIGSLKTIDDYIIKETIGKGTFSTVKLGEHIKTKQKVAIKILNKEKIKEEEDLVRIKREIKILSMMDHPNVIKTYKNIENEKNYYLIMEYCDGGELFNYIVDKEKLDEDEASMFFYQLINALEYIHSLGIAHRDLKPENLLLVKNKLIKIIDFGLSNYFDGETKLETPCGSPSYASPEIIKGELYNGFCIDVWASGIIMFAMLCGYLPFDDDDDENEEKEDAEDDEEEEGENDEEINKNKKKFNSANISNDSDDDSEKSEDNEVMFQKILSGKLDYPSDLSDYAVDLMKKILVVDPKKRIEIKDIKKHKFYLLGQKNYLLNQKNIAKDEAILEPLKDNTTDDKNTKDKYTSCNNDKNSNENKNDDKREITLNTNDEAKIKDIYIEDNNKNKNENKKNVIQKKDIKDEGKKEMAKKDIKDEMEEYEKKLYENYLRKAINIQKNASFMNKKKKENINIVNRDKEKEKVRSKEKQKSKEKEKQKEKKNINININKVNIVNINAIRSMMDKNLKKFSKNKNNYTLNEIILDFNPNSIETNKQTVISSSKRFNTNNNILNQYRVPLRKINPIVRKNFDFSLNSNRNNISNSISNLYFYNENNKNINQNAFTINAQDIAIKRRNYTENKLLKNNINFIMHGNYKKEEQNSKYFNAPSKLNSIDHYQDSSRIKYNKPFLPIIKTSLYKNFANNSINNNKDTSYSSSILKTESSINDNRKRLIYFGKNEFKKLRNNTDHIMNNEFRYKIFNNNNFKKFNFSDFNSIH